MNNLSIFASYIAVVEEGSFTKAAKQLGKTKAIVSRQVNQLEDDLGMRLLNRTTRAVSVTEQGREIYERLLRIMDEVASLETQSNTSTELSGRLRISAPQTFGEQQLMAVLPGFMQAHPHLNVELQLNDRYVDIVEEGFDLAIRIGELEDSSLVARKIGEVAQILVASPEFLAQSSAIVKPEDLENLACIHDNNFRGGLRWRFVKEEKSYQVQIKPRLRVNGAMAAASAARQGLGVSICPDFAIETDLNNGKLVPLLSDYFISKIGIYAVYSHRRSNTPKVSEFIQYLETSLAEKK